MIVLRYKVDDKLVERFWDFCDPPNLTAEALSAILLKKLESFMGNCAEKLVAQTYDGATNLSGLRGGVPARVKEHYLYADIIHCYAHRLNLVVQKSSQN